MKILASPPQQKNKARPPWSRSLVDPFSISARHVPRLRLRVTCTFPRLRFYVLHLRVPFTFHVLSSRFLRLHDHGGLAPDQVGRDVLQCFASMVLHWPNGSQVLQVYILNFQFVQTYMGSRHACDSELLCRIAAMEERIIEIPEIEVREVVKKARRFRERVLQPI